MLQEDFGYGVKADREPQDKPSRPAASREEPATMYSEAVDSSSRGGAASFQPPYQRGPYGDPPRDWNWRMERHYADRYYGPPEDIIRYQRRNR
jgi:hypothetical protein